MGKTTRWVAAVAWTVSLACTCLAHATGDTSYEEPCSNDDPIGTPYPSYLVQSIIIPRLQAHESFSDRLHKL